MILFFIVVAFVVVWGLVKLGGEATDATRGPSSAVTGGVGRK